MDFPSFPSLSLSFLFILLLPSLSIRLLALMLLLLHNLGSPFFLSLFSKYFLDPSLVSWNCRFDLTGNVNDPEAIMFQLIWRTGKSTDGRTVTIHTKNLLDDWSKGIGMFRLSCYDE